MFAVFLASVWLYRTVIPVLATPLCMHCNLKVKNGIFKGSLDEYCVFLRAVTGGNAFAFSSTDFGLHSNQEHSWLRPLFIQLILCLVWQDLLGGESGLAVGSE